MIDVTNIHCVCMKGEEIIILAPPSQLTPEEALRFAAWIVALAEPFAEVRFAEVLAAVHNT